MQIQIQSWTMLIKAIVGDLMLYAIQFQVLPTLLPWFYPSGVIAYILFFGTAFVVFWIWTKYLHVRASEWAVSDIFYFLVVAAYGVQTADGIYGIGTALFHTPYPILNSVLQMEIVWSAIMVFLVTFLQSAACGIQALIEMKANKGE